jgi:hypothetical protein
MKLYNLYQEVILEEIQKQLDLLSEAVSEDEIIKAINGKYNVNITYRDYDDGTPPSRRYIQIYVLGTTRAGNQAIRAYQIGGNTAKTQVTGWKTFRVDRIESITPTNMRWHNPVSDRNPGIPAYNQLGDNSFVSIKAQVDPSTFTRQRSAIPRQPERNVPLRQPERPEQPKKQGPERGRVRPEPEEPEANVPPARPAPVRPAPARPNEPEIRNKEEV